jgi:hypothetical protein
LFHTEASCTRVFIFAALRTLIFFLCTIVSTSEFTKYVCQVRRSLYADDDEDYCLSSLGNCPDHSGATVCNYICPRVDGRLLFLHSPENVAVLIDQFATWIPNEIASHRYQSRKMRFKAAVPALDVVWQHRRMHAAVLVCASHKITTEIRRNFSSHIHFIVDLSSDYIGNPFSERFVDE